MNAFFLLIFTAGFLFFGALLEGFDLNVLWVQAPVFIMVYGPLITYLLYSQGFRGSFSLLNRLGNDRATDLDTSFIHNFVIKPEFECWRKSCFISSK